MLKLPGKKNKTLVDLIAFRAGRWDDELKACRGGCGTKTRDGLSVNGITFPTCGGAECNQKIIAIRKVQ